ncbi:MAG: hypothetical protein QOE90_3076 [Thermoplasmata archaeon]|nr:hypothetical protein [Thermoplasmata archaeon]
MRLRPLQWIAAVLVALGFASFGYAWVREAFPPPCTPEARASFFGCGFDLLPGFLRATGLAFLLVAAACLAAGVWLARRPRGRWGQGAVVLACVVAAVALAALAAWAASQVLIHCPTYACLGTAGRVWSTLGEVPLLTAEAGALATLAALAFPQR